MHGSIGSLLVVALYIVALFALGAIWVTSLYRLRRLRPWSAEYPAPELSEDPSPGLSEGDLEKQRIWRHVAKHQTCPDCLIGGFLEGPSGGMCVNVKCDHCGSEFNLTPFGIDRIRRKPMVSAKVSA